MNINNILLIALLLLIIYFIYDYFADNKVIIDEYKPDYIKYKDVLDFNNMYNKQQPVQQYQKSIGHIYTKKGYKLMSMDPNIKNELVNFWKKFQNNKVTEQKVDLIYNVTDRNINITNLLELNKYDNKLFDKVNNYILQLLKNWTNKTDINHTFTYGMREYTNGAILDTHIDKGYTHIVSAIINVYRDKSWPLIVYDHNNNMESINMTDKEDLVLYESATIFHGRPIPFRGNSFVNLFVHFKTDDWIEVEQKLRDKFNRDEL
jgi:hypothetical protein